MPGGTPRTGLRTDGLAIQRRRDSRVSPWLAEVASRTPLDAAGSCRQACRVTSPARKLPPRAKTRQALLRLPEPLPERDPHQALRELDGWLSQGQPALGPEELEQVKREWPED